MASAVIVACLSWLFDPQTPVDAIAAIHSDAGSTPRETTGSGLADAGPGSEVTPPVMSAAAPEPSSPARPEPTPAASQAAGQANAAQTAATPPQAMIGLLTQRGDAALAVGDIIAARLLYERAATLGSANAATAAGKTYDIDFLVRADTHGIRPDPVAAAAWYRKAIALGDPAARTLLTRVEALSRQ